MNKQEKYDWMVYVRCLTFNHAPYIVDAMNGFTMQETDFPFVCAIVDDASTDGEQEVIKNYLNEHFDLKDNMIARHEETDDYVLTFARHKTNLNCFFAVLYLKYNHYNKKSIAPYLTQWRDKAKYNAMCEGDDCWIDPKKLQKQFEILESHPECSTCAHNALRVTSDGTMRSFAQIANNSIYGIRRILLKSWFTPTASFFYRNNIKIPEDYRRNGANGDMSLLFTTLLQGDLYFTPDVMSKYNYATPGSLSSRTPVKSLYQKKIGLYKAFNQVTGYRYAYLTLPVIFLLFLKKCLS